MFILTQICLQFDSDSLFVSSCRHVSMSTIFYIFDIYVAYICLDAAGIVAVLTDIWTT